MKKLVLALLIAVLPALAIPQSVFSYWSIQHQPAAAAVATISKAAEAGGRHVATTLTVCVTAVAAQARLLFNLRDGATGAGTILWNVSIALPAGQNYCVAAPVTIIGTVNTAMTLESSAAPAATNFATVALNGYTTY